MAAHGTGGQAVLPAITDEPSLVALIVREDADAAGYPDQHVPYRHRGSRHMRPGQTSRQGLPETGPTDRLGDCIETPPHQVCRSPHGHKPIGQTMGAIDKEPRADR